MLGKIEESQLASVFSQDFSADLPGEDCPTAEQLWLTCTLELEVEAREAIIDHCIKCPHCAQELRMTREMVAEYNELLVAASANSVDETGMPRLSLAENGGLRPLRIVQDDPAEPANDEAFGSREELISLGGWRRKLNKITAAGGVLAVAAALAFIVVKKGSSGPGNGADEGARRDKQGANAWRGQDKPSSNALRGEGKEGAHRRGSEAKQSQDKQYRFTKNTLSWPATANAQKYELEIKGKGKPGKCFQTVSSNSLVFDASLCPGLDLSKPFFWRVRAVTKQGQRDFSRFFAVTER